MRTRLWVPLLILALAMFAFGVKAHSAVQSMQGDCCETMCHDMPACAAMVLCQACVAPAASLSTNRVVEYAYRAGFAPPHHDAAPSGPVGPIWTPPD